MKFSFEIVQGQPYNGLGKNNCFGTSAQKIMIFLPILISQNFSSLDVILMILN